MDVTPLPWRAGLTTGVRFEPDECDCSCPSDVDVYAECRVHGHLVEDETAICSECSQAAGEQVRHL
jgi:hypothetical protein